jgi:hypothetical protein
MNHRIADTASLVPDQFVDDALVAPDQRPPLESPQPAAAFIRGGFGPEIRFDGFQAFSHSVNPPVFSCQSVLNSGEALDQFTEARKRTMRATARACLIWAQLSMVGQELGALSDGDREL